MHFSDSDSQDEDPFNKKYLKLQKIAEGTYGIVWKGKCTDTNQLVAIKVFKNISHEGLPSSAVRQIHVIKLLKSEYVLLPMEINIKNKCVSMVSEWKNLTLNKIIKEEKFFKAKNIFKQILRATQSIHDNFIMHRDLKPANIVLDNGVGDNLKIIDFGMAKEIKWNPKLSLTNEVGTLYYRAPELLDGGTKYTKSIDIWAVGCIFYELLTKQALFKEETEFSQLISIYENISSDDQASAFLTNHSGLISNLNRKNWQTIKESLQKVGAGEQEFDLVKKLIQINPQQRISCADALQHQYFKE